MDNLFYIILPFVSMERFHINNLFCRIEREMLLEFLMDIILKNVTNSNSVTSSNIIQYDKEDEDEKKNKICGRKERNWNQVSK